MGKLLWDQSTVWANEVKLHSDAATFHESYDVKQQSGGKQWSHSLHSSVIFLSFYLTLSPSLFKRFYLHLNQKVALWRGSVLTSDLSLSCQTSQPVMSCRLNTYSGPPKYFGLFSCTLKYLNVIVLDNKISVIYFKETWCQTKTFDKKILSFKTIDKWSEDKNTLCMSDVTGIRS